MKIDSKAAGARHAPRGVPDAMLAIRALGMRRQHRHDQVLDVRAVKNGAVSADHLALHAEHGWLATDEKQVARVPLGHEHEPAVEPGFARRSVDSPGVEGFNELVEIVIVFHLPVRRGAGPVGLLPSAGEGYRLPCVTTGKIVNRRISRGEANMTGRFMTTADVPREQLPWGTLGWISRPATTAAKDLVVIDVTLAPGHGHNFHLHPDQEEVLFVLEGHIEQWLERDHRVLGPGDSIFVEKNVVHASFNVSSSPTRFLAILGPSVGEAGYVSVEVGDRDAWAHVR